MQARLKAGWITEADLAPPAAEAAPAEAEATPRVSQDDHRTDAGTHAATDDELDAGPRKGGPGTERLCAVTRAVKPVDELIRFVVGPDGVVPDLKRKLPGRGLWVTAERARR